jgi:hypothetical protein
VADPNPTAAKLTDLLVTVITGVAGGTDDYWRGIIGTVHQLPIIDTVRSNWCVIPGGKPRERKVIAHAAEVIRQAHPYIHR